MYSVPTNKISMFLGLLYTDVLRRVELKTTRKKFYVGIKCVIKRLYETNLSFRFVFRRICVGNRRIEITRRSEFELKSSPLHTVAAKRNSFIQYHGFYILYCVVDERQPIKSLKPTQTLACLLVCILCCKLICC